MNKQIIQKLVATYHDFRSDSLLHNSLYLILGTLVMAMTGFVFWMINTRASVPYEIGLATTLISSVTLITSISMIGLNVSLVRFLPKTLDKNSLISSIFNAIAIVSGLAGFIFVAGLNSFAPDLIEILRSPMSVILFCLFIPLASLNMITDSVFISNGKTIYILLINTVMSIARLLLAVALVGYGAIGIVLSFGLSICLAVGLSLYLLHRYFNFSYKRVINKQVMQPLWKYALGIYLSGIVSSAPTLIMPLIIAARLSPEITAYYYMPTMILNLLLAIPRSATATFIAEGSRELQMLRNLAVRSIAHMYTLFIPAAIITAIFGSLVLSVFGARYSAEGMLYLRLSLASVFIAIPGYVASSVLTVQKKIRLQFILNLVSSLVTLLMTHFYIDRGLYGLGIAAILSQLVIAGTFTATILFSNRWLITGLQNKIQLLTSKKTLLVR